MMTSATMASTVGRNWKLVVHDCSSAPVRADRTVVQSPVFE